MLDWCLVVRLQCQVFLPVRLGLATDRPRGRVFRFMRTLVLIDGQHLYHSARRAWGSRSQRDHWRYRNPDYDVGLLADALTSMEPGRSLSEIRFYTGVPGAQSRGRMKSWRDFWLTKLRRMRRQGIHTYRGSINRGGQEKGVDVSIAIDLVQATHEQRYDVAIIVSQDSDFGPAVRLARQIAESQGRNVEIESAYPFNPLEKRQRGIPGTTWCPIAQSTYLRCLEGVSRQTR